jgi:phosphoribosyl 1,2-cyclic phosphodiesterase
MDFIKFLGTAGARFAVTQQIRNSGGIWLSSDNTNVLIDPGPGSLVRCLSSRPKLDPKNLDGIILSHRHIDHANDINIMIEAMTNGGHKKKGDIFAPSDALDNDPVILHHFRDHVNKIHYLREGETYHIGNITFSTPVTHIHDVETYGIKFKTNNQSISYISDTKYFSGIESYYSTDIIILNVVLVEPKDFINHLSIRDAEIIISKIKPKLAILTHFGMTMIKEKPWEIAKALSKKTNINVIAASDGMQIPIDKKEFI